MKEGISVCMCTYNGEKYISKQLQSIVDQITPSDEIVIVDDMSSDKTVQILNQFSLKYNFIKIYVNKNNIGVNLSFLKVIRKSKNSIIIFSDQDDFWYKDRVENIRSAFEEDNKTMLVSTNAHVLERGRVVNLTHEIYKPTKSLLRVFYKNRFIGCNLAIRREVVEKINRIPRNNYYDHAFALLAMLNGNIVYLSKPMSEYNRHPDTLTKIGTSSSIISIVYSRVTLLIFLIKSFYNGK